MPPPVSVIIIIEDGRFSEGPLIEVLLYAFSIKFEDIMIM